MSGEMSGEIATGWVLNLIVVVAVLWLGYRAFRRLQLSMAKHPSLTGHSKMAKRMAKLVPYFSVNEEKFFSADGANEAIAEKREAAFFALAAGFKNKAPRSSEVARNLETGISDLTFTNTYRVPFPFARFVKKHISLGSLVEETRGVEVRDADGNWSMDVSGSYGVNVFGYDFYKQCMATAMEKAGKMGPVLGSYHPLIEECVKTLKAISGKDEISFHMSGTEAVMQAVRLARYHTGKPRLVEFCGAYHGWWDGVQAGVGNPRKTNDVYTLSEMSERSLRVLRTRNDIACVLINPLQAMHPNKAAPGDSMLISNGRTAHYDREAYTKWLKDLRTVCNERGIVMIMDEVFLGFRIAYGGAQEYFGVQADMVTYGKTLGGGYPIGVVCGRSELMQRFDLTHPADICFARGTFNSHPYVICAMHEFLQQIQTREIQDMYRKVDEVWNGRFSTLNDTLKSEALPVHIVNMVSVCTVIFDKPGRYNWMLQYYMRSEGLSLSWVGSGRMIFSHNYTDADFAEFSARFVCAVKRMQADGWWDVEISNFEIKKQMLKEFLEYRSKKSQLPQESHDVPPAVLEPPRRESLGQ